MFVVGLPKALRMKTHLLVSQLFTGVPLSLMMPITAKNGSVHLWPCCVSVSVLVITISWSSLPHCDTKSFSLLFLLHNKKLMLNWSFKPVSTLHTLSRCFHAFSHVAHHTSWAPAKQPHYFPWRLSFAVVATTHIGQSKLSICWLALSIRLINIVLST